MNTTQHLRPYSGSLEFARGERAFRLSHLAVALVLSAALVLPWGAWADDAAADFSPSSNPNGVWRYGWADSLAPGPTGLNLYTQPVSASGINGWQDPNNVSLGAPSVARNGTGGVNDTGFQTWQPGQLAAHPGQSGEFSFIRWTAAGSQTLLVTASFSGIDYGGGTTTDVHVLHNGVSLFSDLISGFGDTAVMSTTLVVVAAGDTIDFAVGFGSNGSFVSDATGVAARIEPITPTPPATSSLCSPTNAAALSGSTGEQGVLDPSNTIPANQPEGGLIWPATAAIAYLFLDTGSVVFTNLAGATVGTGVLPGVSGGFPAFPDGRLNFSRVRLPPTKAVTIVANAAVEGRFTAFQGVTPPALVLSCQDVILETGSVLAVGVGISGAPIFGGIPVVFPGGFPGGMSNAAGFGQQGAGSLYTSPVSSGGNFTGALMAGGGGGGAGGSTPATCGLGSIECPSGGFGGGSLVLVAKQKATIDGTIYARGTSGVSGGQGGGGGSVRIAAVLVEGNGAIDTSGGSGAAPGPIEIQGFVQNVFSGSLVGSPTGCMTTRTCPVAAPTPSNLPRIEITSVLVNSIEFFDTVATQTGSLVAPDVTVDPAVDAPIDLEVNAFTTDVPNGDEQVFGTATPATLRFRAVGTDGSVVEADALVGFCDCFENEGAATGILRLNPGATYQIVVTPTTAFNLAAMQSGEAVFLARRSTSPVGAVHVNGAERVTRETEAAQLAARWARAFGEDPAAINRVARVTVRIEVEPADPGRGGQLK